MDELKSIIQKQGICLGDGILNVELFLNHQVNISLLFNIGRELAKRFKGLGVSKILTAESGGIIPAFTTAHFLPGSSLVFGKKHKPITMEEAFTMPVKSYTKKCKTQIFVSSAVLSSSDRVLIIDEFMATGNTITALAAIVNHAGAELVGIGTVIEKSFEGGRELLKFLNVPIHSLVDITSMKEGKIVFAEKTECVEYDSAEEKSAESYQHSLNIGRVFPT